MNVFSGFAAKFVSRMVGFCLLALVVTIIGLISEVVGIVEQIPVQRGIDQHEARLTAWYTEHISAGVPFGDDRYVLSYFYDEHNLTTTLPGLPGDPKLGDTLCIEIDATQPEHGRVCGTRGGLGDAESGLIWGGSILAILVGLIVAYYRSRPSLRRRTTLPPGGLITQPDRLQRRSRSGTRFPRRLP